MMKTLTLKYDSLKQFRLRLLVTTIVVSTYLCMTYFHPSNNSWLSDTSFSWSNFLQFFLLDQLAIELVTFTIIARCISLYAKIFGIHECEWNEKGIGKYQLKFLPLFAVVFFLFNPVTQSIRFVYHYFPNFNRDAYMAFYFYSLKLYLTYLFPVFLGGFLFLNINLYRNYRRCQNEKRKDKGKLELSGEAGKVWLEPGQIRYFKREGRINYAFTTRKKLRTPLPLSRIARQLEEYGFVQINRSVVIHLDQLDNYSFWENDKYIVRLKGGVDFVASRNRVKQLKVKLKKEVLL